MLKDKIFWKIFVSVFVVYILMFTAFGYLFNDMHYEPLALRNMRSVLIKAFLFAAIFGYIKYRNYLKQNKND